jgi:pimeloyl-ACP methyl ester carboxylesterase
VPSGNDVELAVHDLGGDGPPLLLAHANGFLASPYAELAALLAPHLHVWAFDFRAHGHSGRPADGSLEWSGFADDVLAVVEALGLERPFGFGHSLGGASLTLAEQRRPGTFRALYLFEPVLIPAGTFPDTGDNPMAAAARRRRASFATRDEAYENYASKPPLSVLTPAALRAYVDEGFEGDVPVSLRCRPEDEAEIFRVGGRNGAFEHLGEVTAPVTVVRGDLVPGPAAFAEQQAAGFANGRLEVLDSMGHFGPLEDPPRVAASVLAALLGG